MTTIAYIILIASALLDLCAMLKFDAYFLQENAFDNSRFFSWLRQNDEFMSTKRLLVLCILFACCTTMAQMSWIVVIILAAVLLAQGIFMFCRKPARPNPLKRHTTRVLATALILTLALLGAVGYLGSSAIETACQGVSILAVTTLAISPLLIMASNWLLRPFKKKNDKNDDKDTQP